MSGYGAHGNWTILNMVHGSRLWRRVQPASYFKGGRGRLLSLRPGAIYDIVLTMPLPLEDVSIEGVSHPQCLPGKCRGISLRKSRSTAREIALNELCQMLLDSASYVQFLQRFPDVVGEELTLPEPEEW